MGQPFVNLKQAEQEVRALFVNHNERAAEPQGMIGGVRGVGVCHSFEESF